MLGSLGAEQSSAVLLDTVRHAVAAVIRPSATSGPRFPVPQHRRETLKRRFNQVAISGRASAAYDWPNALGTANALLAELGLRRR
jgi:hypothetical protein